MSVKSACLCRKCQISWILLSRDQVADHARGAGSSGVLLPSGNIFREYNNVELLPYAVYDRHGVLELVQRSASTFVSTLPYSPAQINDNYHIQKEDEFTVECRKFDELDDGSIDLLSVDTEGSEWYVVKNLVSRPLIISVETHGKSYLNPFFCRDRRLDGCEWL
jgi:FkbM family methyltransferase